MNIPKIESLRQMEIAFCVRMLRENFSLCLRIGRDLVRLLQDLVHVPEFRSIWKDLLYNPSAFKVDGFVDISQMYGTRTSRWYFLLRITPEMESQLRFLLTRVKFGSQKRYQVWFARKFLAVPERKGVVIDIVRFICCAHHPSNEIIHSDIIPRWAVIGWLLKYDLKHYVEANLKLALFYDWIFFDEKVDNIMNIEPAVLLMVHSIPRYIDITHSLLEFLFILLDNYDVERKEIVSRGISTALHALTRKGVVQSLDVLTSCDMLSPIFKERLGKLLSDWQFQHRKEFQSTNIPPGGIPSSSSSLESQTSA
ncbi:integrator complex subunit 3 isoform X3 [Sesamum indicum]|nr:integrator complex subunit 3 isoform X3 [Sesamum indicum]